MTPREIVRATLDFANPPRVARSFAPSDIVFASCDTLAQTTPWTQIGEHRWQRLDIWGNVWQRVDATSMGEVVKGALDNLTQLRDYTFPNLVDPGGYRSVQQQREAHPDSWLIGSLPGFTFSIARKMRRLECYLMDLLVERDLIRHLHDRIDDLLEAMILNYASAGVDAVMAWEDWGTQQTTLINPHLWFQEFYPRFERLFAVAHAHGLRVFMHSCGQMEAIVPGLIRAGIDVLQFDQPDLHGIDTLAVRQQTSRITFWCPVDIQTTLQTRDCEVIQSKAKEMLDKLWRGRGGFIAGYYNDNSSIGLDPQWQHCACEAFLKHGVRERYR